MLQQISEKAAASKEIERIEARLAELKQVESASMASLVVNDPPAPVKRGVSDTGPPKKKPKLMPKPEKPQIKQKKKAKKQPQTLFSFFKRKKEIS